MTKRELKYYIEKIIRSYSKIIFSITALGVFIMFSLVSLQVLFRYVFNFSVYWIEEAARYTMIFLTFSGALLALKDNTHPRIKLFINYMTSNLINIWECVLKIFIMYFYFILTVYGWTYANSNSFIITPGLRISFFWPYLIIPFFAFLTLIYLLFDVIKTFCEIIDPKEGE